jgi:signal peptidase I
VAAILAMAAIGAWAVMTDRVSYVITDGVSMNPVYYQGDLVFVIKADSYHVGQIAAYHGSSPGQKVLHRIISGDDALGFAFKGDNNESIDPLKPTAGELIGRAVLHVPKGGIWLKPLLGPSGLGMLGFLVFSNAGGTRNRREIPRGRRKKRVKAMSHQGSPLAMAMAVIKIVARLPLLLRAVAGLLAFLAVLGIALAVLGWMKPVTTIQKAIPGLAQSMTFGYTAKVPRSAAYDGTTVTSPDPIFRKLTNKVDLNIGYHGRAGIFDVTAKLTNGSGWHSTMELVPARAFSGADYDVKVPLDLDAFDKRSEAAAAAIGIQPGPVVIDVTARVAAVGHAAFTASLQLSLSPLELTLASGSDPMAVKETGGGQPAARVLREIGVFGHNVMTASQARSDAMFLLIVALTGAAGIALLARRDPPLRTRAEIERRHPQLLVHVEPMPSPPGKPVVNVDNFPALVKLAERYGQMILTWQRPDADDFVVRDEGITYRYRVPLDEPTLQNVELIDRPPGAGTHRRRAASEVS